MGRDEAVDKFRHFVNIHTTMFLSLSARLMIEVFEVLADEDEIKDKHIMWMGNANNIETKLGTAKEELRKCGLVVTGFTNGDINEDELRGEKNNAFAQVCNINGFCNFNNFLGRCDNERIPASERNTGAHELRRSDTREVGVCEHFRHNYGQSHGFGQNLFEADHPSKKRATGCYDMFRGSTGWWRCTPVRSYPYALPNYCAPPDCAGIFRDDNWWTEKTNTTYP